MESPLNVMKPSGISRGAFYERHFLADVNFYGTRLSKEVGGVWNGSAIGLSKPNLLGRLWYGSPGPLKWLLGGTGAAGAGAAYWYNKE